MYKEIYVPTDDDLDILADIRGKDIKILPYPEPLISGTCCKSRLPTIILNETANYLKPFHKSSKVDVYLWIILNASKYLKMLGPKKHNRFKFFCLNYKV